MLATTATALVCVFDADASGVGSATGTESTAPHAGSTQPLPAPQAGSQQPAEQSGSPQQPVPQQLFRACFAFSAASRSRIGWCFFRTPQHEAAPQAGSQQPAPASHAGSAQPLPAPQAGSAQPFPAPQAGSQQPSPAPQPGSQQLVPQQL